MRFAKLQALGNDFLVVESADVPAGATFGDLARRLCDRHFGAGADGLIVARPGGDGCDVSSRIFNADGGEAEVSGNGTRCLAAYVDTLHGGRDELAVGTAAGVKRLRIVERTGTTRRIEMEMGAPVFATDRVPFHCDPPQERAIDWPLEVEGRTIRVAVLSVGNPHCTIFADVNGALDPRAIGPLVERHPSFPNRVNVEFATVVDRERIGARFWERGVGMTLASGTGATAAAIAGAATGRTERRVTVDTDAGSLLVEWRDADDVVVLTGPAELLYVADWLGGV